MLSHTFKRRIRPTDPYTQCVCCNEPFSEKNVFTHLGAKETQLSGMCEACFDAMFEDDEE